MNETRTPLVRWKAVNSLACIGASGLPFLVETAKNEKNETGLRQAAAAAVGSMGTNAIDAVADLAELVNDNDATVARMAAMSPVLLLDPGTSVRALADGLKSPNDGVRWACAASLSKLDGRGARAVPALVQSLNDPSPRVRLMVTNALRIIAPWELGRSTETNFESLIFNFSRRSLSTDQ
jgi:HEAT repeat protein